MEVGWAWCLRMLPGYWMDVEPRVGQRDVLETKLGRAIAQQARQALAQAGQARVACFQIFQQAGILFEQGLGLADESAVLAGFVLHAVAIDDLDLVGGEDVLQVMDGRREEAADLLPHGSDDVRR